MELITKEIEKKFEAHPLYSTDGQPVKEVLAKFFNPCGAGTWYVFEAEKQDDGDWLFFGYVELLDGELGYFTLSQLEHVRLPFGMGIERDRYATNLVYDVETGKVTSKAA